MTDLKGQLSRLLDDEPEAPYDVDDIVRSGRRARRRRNVALTVAGTAGAAGLTVAVVLPVLATSGNQAEVKVGSPAVSPSPTAAAGKCYLVAGTPTALKRDVARLVRSGRVGDMPSVSTVKAGKLGKRAVWEVCPQGTSPKDLSQEQPQDSQPPAGPPYDYTDKPAAIASRLGTHLHDRVTGLGLSISYTRPFSPESSTMDSGRPSYYGGNVDVHEADGYADIGVQVTHEVTELVPFTGDCTVAEHCTETKLSDGSVLRTGQVEAGKGDVVLTAEVHRPNGVVVQAQESNYPFGPDAGSQQHGDQPLTVDQLVALAEDDAFTF